MRVDRQILRSRLARRIFTTFVACALIPLGLLGAFAYEHVSSQLFQQASRELRTECRTVGLGAVEYLHFLESDLKIAVAALEANQRGGPAPSLESLPEGFDQRFHGLGHFDGASGAKLFQLGEAPTPRRLDRSQWQHLLDGNTLVHFEPVPNGPADVELTRLLADGETIVVGDAVSEPLWESIEAEGDHFALDREGILLYSSLGPDTPVEVIRAQLEENPVSGKFTWKRDGEEQRVAYRQFFLEPTFALRLTVGCSRSLDEILAPMQSFKQLFLLACFLTLLVVMLLSVGQIRRSLVPIELLHAATRRIANNDFGTPTQIESGDEFEDLGDAFNFMSASLLERTTELELASRAKLEFLANMSHELRTPMTAILGFAEVCQEPGTPPEERDRCLTIVRENSAHLLRVINDVLDVSKIEAGRMSVELTHCSPSEIVENLVTLLEPAAREKGLQLDVDLDGTVPNMISTDATRVQQVLLNLLGNAVKFTEAGRVAIRVFMRPGPHPSERGVLAFEVGDTGIGLSTEQMSRIFEPFVQADTTTTRVYGGTGLGLSISRSLARLLGGDIECQSSGSGSVFTLTIDPGAPAEDPPAPVPSSLRAEAPAESDEPPLRGRALVADDVMVNCKLASMILTRAGMNVTVVGSGVEAHAAAMAALREGEPFAVVLMDMQMPEMDGYTATRLLREEGYDAPIIAFTSHSMAEESERCSEAGCDGFATKPIERPALLELIRSLTERQAAADGD